MKWKPRWRPARDFDDEIAAHLQMETDRLMAEGMTQEQARLTARREFGNATRTAEEFRERRPWAWAGEFAADFSRALAGIARRPLHAASVILTLTLGIGATSAIFSILDTVLLKPLPYPDGDRLVSLYEENRELRVDRGWPALARIGDWSALTRSFAAITGYYTENASETGGELPEKVVRAICAPRFFEVWGVGPVLGRGFTADEQRFGGPAAAVISHRLWARRFGADAAAVGKTLRLGSAQLTIVGVMPEGFQFPAREVDVWLPAQFPPSLAANRGARFMVTVARLRPGVSLEAARSDLAAAQRQLAERYPATDGGAWRAGLEPLKEVTVGGVRRTLWILFGAVSLLVAIACGNVASLLLAQARQRAPEIAVRFTLGASRARVIRQLLTEGLTLALAGAAAGLMLAFAALAWLRAAAVATLPRAAELRLDWRLVLFTLGLACFTTLLFALMPALRLARPSSALAGGSMARGQVSGRHGPQYLLVGVQVALTVVLLAGSGLLLRTLHNLNRVNPGFDPERVLTLRVSASWGETNNRPAVRQRLARVLDGLATVPGVESAAISSSIAGLSSPAEGTYRFVDDASAGDGGAIVAHSAWVSANYFRVTRIPILSGATCRDEGETTPEYLVNRRFVERFSPDRNVLGRELTYTGPGGAAGRITGVVGDVRETGLDREAPPVIYTCGVPSWIPDPVYLVRAGAGDPMALANSVRRKIREISPTRSVFDVKPLAAHLSDSGGARRFNALLLTLFAGTALALAAIGLYGLMNCLVASRTREFGLRIAVGAQSRQILWQVLAKALAVTAAGLCVGLAGAAVVTRWLAAMLFGVQPLDALTFIAAAGLLAAVAAVSALLPARRATLVDPVRALRNEA